MSFIDVLIIVAYVVGFIVIGVLQGKKVKGGKDFTNAGQKMPFIIVLGSMLATCMGASIAFGNPNKVFNFGLSGITSACGWYLGWIMLDIMAKPLRKSGATSIPDFLAKRYGEKCRVVAAFAVLAMSISHASAQFISCGAMSEALGLTDKKTGIILGAIVIVLFTVFSGLWGVAITDSLQVIILVSMICIVLPITCFSKAGGVGAVIDYYKAVDPAKLSPFAGMTFATFLGFFWSGMFNSGAEPSYSQRLLSAKDVKTAVKGTIGANIMGFCAMVMGAVGAMCIPLLFPTLTNGETFVPRAIAELMPVGIRGLAMAALLGLLITTGDTFLLLLSSTLSSDIMPMFKKDWDPNSKKALKFTRYSIVLIAVVVLLLGLYVNNVFAVFQLGSSVYGSACFFPVLLGCYWKKCNGKATNIAMWVAGGLCLVWDLFGLKDITGIAGVTFCPAICLAICVIGSLILNSKDGQMQKVEA